MDNLKYLLAFSKAGYSDSSFIRSVIDYFGSAKDAWMASNADLLEINGVSVKKVENLFQLKMSITPDSLLEEIEKRKIKVLTIDDPDYPFLLKQIENPPAVLYVKGDISRCNLDKTLAIVGSRKASSYITDILNKLVDDLKGTDITIVSGLAAGIDAYSHKAAIKNDLKTIGVIASGLDHIYPKENRELYNLIEQEKGAIISEYFPAERPEIWKFPKRNRIISGLSKGTLIAEAGLKSGALITAQLCLEQNRELMCIPGLITNPNTEGIYKLVKDGAGLVTNAKDILNYLNWQYDLNTGNNRDDPKIKLLDNERKIYEILSLEAKQFDEILDESKMEIQELMSVITTMELSGIIKQLPGQKYTKTM